jgi:hypothetical protein
MNISDEDADIFPLLINVVTPEKVSNNLKHGVKIRGEFFFVVKTLE